MNLMDMHPSVHSKRARSYIVCLHVLLLVGVMCDKCRMWGKLQSQGLATALKILFAMPSGYSAQSESDASAAASATAPPHFQLRRNEIVALFNAFGRRAAHIRFASVHYHFSHTLCTTTSHYLCPIYEYNSTSTCHVTPYMYSYCGACFRNHV